jgi:hypothetical protein
LENANGGTLTIRLSGNGVAANVNIQPGGGTGGAAYTPGIANSVRAVLPPLPTLWLNEVLPNNVAGATDRFGHRHAWAEIYNGGSTGIDLGGTYLANNYSNLTQWPFPSGTIIGAGQFLPVWLDTNPGESTATELHSTFTIPAAAGSLALVNVNNGVTNILDYLNYSVTTPDRSYGSFPDGSVSGRRIFYYATPGATNNPAQPPLDVVVNEWMADNVTTLADPSDGDFEDWFELYNSGDAPADLSGFYLGSSLTNRTQFLIPGGYIIPPHGRLLVWADSETGQNDTNVIDLHAGFKLSKQGDGIGIFAADGTEIDFVTFGAQASDVTGGRYPDGAVGVFALSSPTPRAANYLATSNSAPLIGSIADQVVIEGQLLVVTAVAVDAEAPPQTLTFSLDPGVPFGMTINPVNGLLSWRPASSQSPGTNVVAVRVTDDGTPPMSAATVFTVRVAPRPQVTSVTPTGNGGYDISFLTVPGKTYRVECKDSLNDPTWSPVNVDVVATGNSLIVTDEIANSPHRFYRITVLN